MKNILFQRLFSLVILCLCLTPGGFAQPTNSRISGGKPQAGFTQKINDAKRHTLANRPLAPTKTSSVLDCSNDLIAPEINCPAGACLPDARAAYLTSANGEPWGVGDNYLVMDAVFGSGNWDAYSLEFSDVSSLLTPAYKVLFLEGSDNNGHALEQFLTAHLTEVENWVSAGGALFLNCAPNYAPSTINFGFGGVTLQSFVYSGEANAAVPNHPIFNGPFTPANSPFYGSSFSHAAIQGDFGQVLITDPSGSQVILSEKNWGNGKVYFGGMTTTNFHSPWPNAQNMRQNILADLNAHCNAGLVLTADAGACFATIADAAFDATATDDCVLASLTHNFAAAPNNTTLSGATLPAGNTLIQWTAIDAAGNITTCETNYSVREPEAPVAVCPSDITVFADPGTCGAVVNFAPTATDNCTASPSISTYPASGSVFPLGSTSVVVNVLDESYNLGTCSFFVNVNANPEICNGLDDDCNGYIDDGAMGETTVYADFDGDGYGDPNNSLLVTCPIPSYYVFNSLDCDDTNYYIQPGMYEICNGVDDNCDGNIDEGVAPTWYADADGDGYGDPNTTIVACNPPQGYSSNNWDCVDTDSYIHPGAMEDCTNLTDENCDGILGENNFVIEETHGDVFCGSNPDGTITLNLVPAQNYPVILWSNGTCCTTTVTNLQAGTYKVTVSNECGTTKTKSIVIAPAAEPALKVNMVGTSAICGGASDGTITATPEDGCGGYTYQWNTGSTDATISGLTGGTYEVVVTDACGCTKFESFNIQQADPTGLYFATIIPLLDGTYFVQVVPYGGFGPFQFRRSTPTGFTDWSASNGFMGVLPGDYAFEVQDVNGCTAQITVTLSPLSPMQGSDPEAEMAQEIVENRSNESAAPRAKAWEISLFPNPNKGNFTVDLHETITETMILGISDQTGRLLLEKQVEAGNSSQNVQAENLPSGIYFLQVMTGGKVIAVEKFVKE